MDHGGQCLEGLKMIVSVAPQQTSVRRTGDFNARMHIVDILGERVHIVIFTS